MYHIMYGEDYVSVFRRSLNVNIVWFLRLRSTSYKKIEPGIIAIIPIDKSSEKPLKNKHSVFVLPSLASKIFLINDFKTSSNADKD